jgi:betaine-aldehyde dehydrogenase
MRNDWDLWSRSGGRVPELFRDGQWHAATAGGTREIRCPANGELVATVDEAEAEDTNAAIESARRAFDAGEWSATSVHERGALLYRLADILLANKDTIARAESLDTGKRLVESEYDVDDVVSVFRHYANTAAVDAGRVVDTGRPDIRSRIVHEPIGVCALITPWNYPLLQTSWKVAPALAAGNTFVLKPSELTPASAILLMRYLSEAGLPAGVANLVGRWPGHHCPLTPTSTWSPSPAGSRRARRSWPLPPTR